MNRTYQQMIDGVLDNMVAEKGRPMQPRTLDDLKSGMAGTAWHGDTPAFATFFTQPAKWMSRAACAGMATDMFFTTMPQGRKPQHDPDVQAAAAVCAGCPVRVECRDYAVATDTDYGVWGGSYFCRGREVRIAA